jgi:hypothetical protein
MWSLSLNLSNSCPVVLPADVKIKDHLCLPKLDLNSASQLQLHHSTTHHMVCTACCVLWPMLAQTCHMPVAAHQKVTCSTTEPA